MIRVFSSVAAAAFFTISAAMAQQSGPQDPAEILSTVDPEQRRVTEAIVRDYILRNPEIVLEAIRTLQSREQAVAGESAIHAVAANHRALRYDPATPVGGNPNGDVTIVEFFDYACPYCRDAYSILAPLIKDDPNIRFVYKELPVLGEASIFAARVGIAVHLLAPDLYLDFHAAMFQARGRLRPDITIQTAVELGVDRVRLMEAIESYEVGQLVNRNLQLAQTIGIKGTPGFLIGDAIVPGLIQIDQFKQLIAQAREYCASCQ
jgi:protein-disulfide isomerase